MTDVNSVNTASRKRLQGKAAGGAAVTVKGAGSDTSATDKAALGSVAGKGLKGDTSADAPKQESGESLQSFSARMRAFREKRRGATMDQAGSALGAKLGSK